MPQEERYGTRSLVYSTWHRGQSIGRFMEPARARLLAQIDMDHHLWVEYDDGTKEPLALIEEGEDVGQTHKTATVTQNLARRSSLPALLVLWEPSDEPNPANTKWPDIERFRIMRLWPKPEKEWRTLSPREYAEVLLKMRDCQVGGWAQ